MVITYEQKGRKWVAEVLDDKPLFWFNTGTIKNEILSEEIYVSINQWCIDTLGYHARSSYHIFTFKKRSDLNWFVLRWT